MSSILYHANHLCNIRAVFYQQLTPQFGSANQVMNRFHEGFLLKWLLQKNAPGESLIRHLLDTGYPDMKRTFSPGLVFCTSLPVVRRDRNPNPPFF